MRDLSAAQTNNGSGLMGRLGTCIAALLVLLALMPSAVWSLELSADQKQKMKAVGTNSRAAIESQRKTLRAARMDLFGVYREYKLDESKAQDAMKRVGGAQRALLDLQFDDQDKIRQILKAEQFADFQKMVNSRVRHMGPGMEPPAEVKVLDDALKDALSGSAKLSADQAKRVDMINRIGQKRQDVMAKMRASTEQLADMYSKYDLDNKAAHKVLDSIHHNQMMLMWMTHRQQQAIRAVLTEDQFNTLRQAMEQKFKAMWHNNPRFKDRDHDDHK